MCLRANEAVMSLDLWLRNASNVILYRYPSESHRIPANATLMSVNRFAQCRCEFWGMGRRGLGFELFWLRGKPLGDIASLNVLMKRWESLSIVAVGGETEWIE